MDNAGAARFTSYVNNLHKRDAAAVTPLLERLFSLVVPRIEQVHSPTEAANHAVERATTARTMTVPRPSYMP